MRLAYDYFKSIIVINGELTKEDFINKCGVDRGYSKEMFERIYENIYSELVDLKDEYNIFYHLEYDSFEEFLFRKLNIKEEDIEMLMKFSKSKNYLKIYRSGDASSGDYGIGSFIYSEPMYDRINALIT
jgi:hypothetical protein